MSGYLPKPDDVCKSQRGHARPPIFMAHGDEDETVRLSWATSAKKRIDDCCIVDTSMKVYRGLTHSANMEELDDVYNFMASKLEISSSPKIHSDTRTQ